MICCRFFTLVLAGLLFIPTVAPAGDKHSGKKSTVKDVKAMSEKDQTALALSAAPARIAKDAGVMVYGADGKLTEVRKSTNGFVCVPTVMNLPEPDPPEELKKRLEQLIDQGEWDRVRAQKQEQRA